MSVGSAHLRVGRQRDGPPGCSPLSPLRKRHSGRKYHMILTSTRPRRLNGRPRFPRASVCDFGPFSPHGVVAFGVFSRLSGPALEFRDVPQQ